MLKNGSHGCMNMKNREKKPTVPSYSSFDSEQSTSEQVKPNHNDFQISYSGMQLFTLLLQLSAAKSCICSAVKHSGIGG